MVDQITRISKFLSRVLRHQPQTIHLSLDTQGWAEVNELIFKVNRAGIPLTMELLKQVVEINNKQRFAFSPDGQKIRASQGHSIPVDLGLEPVIPPEYLYHGTAKRNIESIRKEGLLRGKRNHVHLSKDETTAKQVGRRHGEPVVLRVKTKEMIAAGYRFFLSANGIWLTERVPATYIEFVWKDEG